MSFFSFSVLKFQKKYMYQVSPTHFWIPLRTGKGRVYELRHQVVVECWILNNANRNIKFHLILNKFYFIYIFLNQWRNFMTFLNVTAKKLSFINNHRKHKSPFALKSVNYKHKPKRRRNKSGARCPMTHSHSVVNFNGIHRLHIHVCRCAQFQLKVSAYVSHFQFIMKPLAISRQRVMTMTQRHM